MTSLVYFKPKYRFYQTARIPVIDSIFSDVNAHFENPSEITTQRVAHLILV